MTDSPVCKMKLNSATVVETPWGEIDCRDAQTASVVMAAVHGAYYHGWDLAQREMRKALGLTDKT